MGPCAVCPRRLQRGLQPLNGDRTSGQCEIFADGFAGAMGSPGQAEHRPSGLAVGPDGSLYVSDDIRGRIYRIDYRGGADFDAATVTPCPSAAAPAGNVVATAHPGDESRQRQRGPASMELSMALSHLYHTTTGCT
jgi:DNA-binding beta-propeller fold protein YncE